MNLEGYPIGLQLTFASILSASSKSLSSTETLALSEPPLPLAFAICRCIEFMMGVYCGVVEKLFVGTVACQGSLARKDTVW